MGVTMSGPSTFEKRRRVTLTWGLSSAKSRTYPSTDSRLRSMLERAGWLRGVSSVNQTGSSLADPYTYAEDFTTTSRTDEPGADAAANRFIVPITLISCIVLGRIEVESMTRKVCAMVSICAACTMRDRIE